MAAPDITNVLRVPGKLFTGVTDLGTSAPYGGTALGSINQAHWSPTFRAERILAEEFGGEVVDVVYLGENWVLGARLREWNDDDSSALPFLNTSAGSSSGATVIDHPGNNRAGKLLSDVAAALLFVPYDATNHPSLILYNAIPLVEQSARLRLASKSELAIPVLFLAIRDSSDRQGSVGRLEDLSI